MGSQDAAQVLLTASRLVVAARDGRSVTVDLEPDNWDSLWQNGLSSLDAPLADAVRALGLRRANARIVFAGPDGIVDIIGSPLRGETARSSGELALRDILPQPASDWTTSVHELDGVRMAGSATTLLAVAERRETLDMLHAWTVRAGLHASTFVQARAVVLAQAAREAMRRGRTERTALLLLDDRFGAVAVADASGLLVARAVEMGYGVLIDAVRSASRARCSEIISMPRARELLLSTGIPAWNEVYDERSSLRAKDVLPLMQSCLQKFFVEVRQTLRFVLPESEIARTSVTLVGDGARIPGLAAGLEALLEAPVNPDAPTQAEAPAGELQYREAVRSVPRLMPTGVLRERQARRRSLALRAGATLAAMLLAVETSTLLLERIRIESQLDRAMPVIEAHAAQQSSVRRAAELGFAVDTARVTVIETLGDRPFWLAALGDISRVAGSNVRLSDLSGAGGRGLEPPTLTLTGLASADPSEGEVDPLAALMQRLAAAPSVARAELKSSRVVSDQGQEAMEFVIVARLHAVPPSVPGGMLAQEDMR